MVQLGPLLQGLKGRKQSVPQGCGLTVRLGWGRICFQVYTVVSNIQFLKAAGLKASVSFRYWLP